MDLRNELFSTQNGAQIQGAHPGTTDPRWDEMDESNLEGQRSAAEAVASGQETLLKLAVQGEQIANAEETADSNKFLVDKSNRILKGMTWSGWFSNMFTPDIKAGGPSQEAVRMRMTAERMKSSGSIDDVGGDLSNSHFNMSSKEIRTKHPATHAACQCINDYKNNVLLLRQAPVDQRDLLASICEELRCRAVSAMSTLEKLSRSVRDECVEREFGELSMEMKRVELSIRRSNDSNFNNTKSNDNKNNKNNELMTGATRVIPTPSTNGILTSSASSEAQIHLQKQEQHLASLAPELAQITKLSMTINEALTDQNKALENLEYKTDNLTEKTKLVVRRAGRLNQRSSWVAEKPKFFAHCTIRHMESQRFLTISGETPTLGDHLLRDNNRWKIWKRQGNAFGLQNAVSDKYVGQSFLGNIVCSSNKMGRNEEVEMDEGNLGRTPFLVSSAGWGKGSYLLWNEKKLTFAKSKEEATLWEVEILGETESTE